MERASLRADNLRPLDAALLGAAVKAAVRAAAREEEPVAAIDAGVGVLHATVEGIRPSLFVLEHRHLWVVAQRGYAFVPDGIGIEQGVMGRAVRLGRGEVVPDVHADPDYLEALPAVVSEAAIPLRVGRVTVGVLNVDSEYTFPPGSLEILHPLATELAPRAQELRSGVLDLPGLARLFAYLGSLRDPIEIAGLAAASLARVLRLETSQVWAWEDGGAMLELAAWHSETARHAGLTAPELEAARGEVDPGVVCQLLELKRGSRRRGSGAVVWLPLRANGKEIGALVGTGGGAVSSGTLDTAAVLAAHSAASLDAALALRRERRSAVTDSLTGILNRRGLEERLELEVASAQERRLPLSVLVLDCDDFKDVNDRAGHEFGDSLLREVGEALARSLPEGADAARLGGDEFVVVLPGADAEEAVALGSEIRGVLAAGLSDAGFPLSLSGGVATYPFDGGTATSLIRAADQALYLAKETGKDRVASFRQVITREDLISTAGQSAAADERRRSSRGDGSVISDALAASRAIESEETADAVLERLCKGLVFVVGVTACSASRVVDAYLVDAANHALREVSLGHEATYRISDFPVTAETLRLGTPRAVSFLDSDVDSAEAFILRELGMNAMLMFPVRVRGESWGLVELYDMRLRRFTEDDFSLGLFLVAHAERRLEEIASLETSSERPPVYELPPDAGGPGSPTR